MIGPLLLLLQQAIPHRFVLERKLADELAELFDFVVHGLVASVAQEDKEFAKSSILLLNNHDNG
jgi:hypothetical protein